MPRNDLYSEINELAQLTQEEALTVKSSQKKIRIALGRIRMAYDKSRFAADNEVNEKAQRAYRVCSQAEEILLTRPGIKRFYDESLARGEIPDLDNPQVSSEESIYRQPTQELKLDKIASGELFEVHPPTLKKTRHTAYRKIFDSALGFIEPLELADERPPLRREEIIRVARQVVERAYELSYQLIENPEMHPSEVYTKEEHLALMNTIARAKAHQGIYYVYAIDAGQRKEYAIVDSIHTPGSPKIGLSSAFFQTGEEIRDLGIFEFNVSDTIGRFMTREHKLPEQYLALHGMEERAKQMIGIKIPPGLEMVLSAVEKIGYALEEEKRDFRHVLNELNNYERETFLNLQPIPIGRLNQARKDAGRLMSPFYYFEKPFPKNIGRESLSEIVKMDLEMYPERKRLVHRFKGKEAR